MTVISLLTQSSCWLASPNISSVCNKLHTATRLCYVTVLFALPVIMAPSALTSSPPSSPSGTWLLPDHLASWAAVTQRTALDWKHSGLLLKGEVIKLLKETKADLRGMSLDKDRFERASGKDCASWCFPVPTPPHFFLDGPEVTL